MAAAASSAAASSASITVTYKTLPSATQANVWLRWPYLVVCDGGLVQVFDAHTPAEGSRSAGDEAGSVGDSFLQCVHQFSLPRYHVGAAATGRGANVLHGLDVRAGCLVGGTASGLVLHVALPPSGGSLPTIGELVGHTKVVGFVQLAVHTPDDELAYTSSLDRTVRQWSLRQGACLQVVKAGTAVLSIALLPPPPPAGTAAAGTAAAGAPPPAGPQLLMGCHDGTVRLWEVGCRKTSKALATLRYQHDSYVGSLQLSADGTRLLTCGRSGQLQLWRRHEKEREKFVAAPELLPRTAAGEVAPGVACAWRLDLLSRGLLAVSAAGGVHFWAWGARAPLRLRPDALACQLLDQPAESFVAESCAAAPCAAEGDAPQGGEAAARATLVFAGLRRGGARGEAGGAAFCLELHRCVGLPLPSTPTGDAAAGGGDAARQGEGGGGGGEAAVAAWEGEARMAAWHGLAIEMGVTPDDELRQQLLKMTRVAEATGQPLGGETVRNFLRRRKQNGGRGERR